MFNASTFRENRNAHISPSPTPPRSLRRRAFVLALKPSVDVFIKCPILPAGGIMISCLLLRGEAKLLFLYPDNWQTLTLPRPALPPALLATIATAATIASAVSATAATVGHAQVFFFGFFDCCVFFLFFCSLVCFLPVLHFFLVRKLCW